MSPRFRYLFFAFFAFFLFSCQQPPPTASSPENVLPYVLVTPVSQKTATPTPFQPNSISRPAEGVSTPLPTATLPTETRLENTAIATATVTITPWATNTSLLPTQDNTVYITATPNFYGDTWDDYPEPAYYPLSIAIPPPVGMLSQPKDQINILLLGSDIRPPSTHFRTDTIIMLTIDKNSGAVNLTSFPRDLYVYIPGWTMQRINTAMARGYHTLGMTMAYNFGVYPDHYVMVNFTNFILIVNSLGGIDVNVEKDFSDQRAGFGWYQVKKGTIHMDGDTALWYIRSRYTSSDIDRLRRAQEVIQAIGYRLLSFDILTRSPEIYRIYKDSVYTDLGLRDFLALIPTAKKLMDTQDIQRYVIDYNSVYEWVEPYTGAMVLLPNRYKIMPIIKDALNVR